jgi:hypothetical protein
VCSSDLRPDIQELLSPPLDKYREE